MMAKLMLLGFTAVGIPIVLHFFYKARHRPLPWAAMRFLRLSIEQTSRRVKFQELILLFLRCLALILLTLAFTRISCSFSGSGRGESVDAVLIIDTSYSMGAREGASPKTRFERAKDAAISVIRGLPKNSTVQIYTCSDRVTQLKFTQTNFDQAISIVSNLELTSLSGDIMPGLTEAYGALDRGVAANKEVYVFSDLQKSGWERQSTAIREMANDIRKKASLVLVRCAHPDLIPKNIAITNITFPGGIPVVGTRIPFTVLLRNTGTEAVSNISVTLQIDGDSREIDTGFVTRIEPKSEHAIELTGRLRKAGSTLLTAKIGYKDAKTGQIMSDTNLSENRVDDLPGDNRFDRLINVRDSIRVLVIDGAPDPTDDKESSSHYIRNALQPVTASALQDYFVKIQEIRMDEQTPAPGDLGPVDICILSNVASSDQDKPGIRGLSPSFIDRLKEFVSDGGTLVIGSGDFVTVAGYNRAFDSRGLLPFPLKSLAETDDNKPFNPTPDTIDTNSYIANFKNPPFSNAVSVVEIFKILTVDETSSAKPDSKTGGRVILRTESNLPLISTRTVDRGEVVFFHTSLDSKWTNWPAKVGGASYVPMIRQLLAYVSGKSTRTSNRIAGESLTWNPLKNVKSYDIIKPNGSRIGIGGATGGTPGVPLNVSTNESYQAGIYQMAYTTEALPSGPQFAVVPDLRESNDLESMNDASFEKIIGFRPNVISGNMEIDSEIGNLRHKGEWTVWFLGCAFVIVLVEVFWAWFCGREK